ncbi:MAG: type II toxin-antitoxin system VapC family toxin [Lachnospiraceae bacterium]|nr:type II toxin-antitoxin system VapC family toxin [Solobacterium sp.]MBR3308975.1 type II toxin-antitoxin system VapC family toxin [Lachnospiraceae bacterium]
MRYMLDTNIIVYAKNARPEIVLKRFQQYNPGDLCISAITMAELEYGVFNSSKPKQNRLALLMFLSNIEVIPFDMDAAKVYGQIRHDLKEKGELIGANDLLIAAHAKSLAFTLITNNTREFGRVEGLKLNNWM